MTAIEHQFSTPASPQAVFEAAATQAGIRRWWCVDCDVSERLGGSHELRFVKGGTPVKMTFEVTALESARRVEWKCTANDNPSWVGSTLVWEIAPQPEGASLRFTHAAFADDGPGYQGTVDGWPRFIDSLQAVLRGEPGNPL